MNKTTAQDILEATTDQIKFLLFDFEMKLREKLAQEIEGKDIVWHKIEHDELLRHYSKGMQVAAEIVRGTNADV